MMTMSKHLKFNDPDYVPCRTCRDRKKIQTELIRTSKKLERHEQRHEEQIKDLTETIKALRTNAKQRRAELDKQEAEIVYLRKQVRSLVYSLESTGDGSRVRGN
jgi:septal ring factor EnvC (AmiA/AmiB activator)